MTTITIQKKQVNENNIIFLEIVDLDSEKFFHIHGLKRSIKVDHRVDINGTDSPCQQAQAIYDYYVSLLWG